MTELRKHCGYGETLRAKKRKAVQVRPPSDASPCGDQVQPANRRLLPPAMNPQAKI